MQEPSIAGTVVEEAILNVLVAVTLDRFVGNVMELEKLIAKLATGTENSLARNVAAAGL